MGLKELKSNLAKAGWVPWSAWCHSQTNICMGRDKVGGWRWECCLRLALMPDASWWPTEDLSHFRCFQTSESTFLALCVVLIWLSHVERPGGEDAASGGWVQARPSATWERAALALLIYQLQWFTAIDVHIPECQNNLCLKRNQWLRLWFYLRPFPDKWLNCAWSWENSAEEQGSVLASVCVCGEVRERTPLCVADLPRVSAVSLSSGKTQVWWQLCFGASSGHFCPALMWEHGPQCWTAQF